MTANTVTVLSPEETAAVSGAGPTVHPVETPEATAGSAWLTNIELNLSRLKAGASEILMES